MSKYKFIDLEFYKDFTKHLIIEMKLEEVREIEKMLKVIILIRKKINLEQ